MNTDEVREVLVRMALFDGRQVEEVTVLAWAEVLADVHQADAIRAVVEHYGASREWLMPVHIVTAAAHYQDQRDREARKLIEYGGNDSDVVVKPPYYADMIVAAHDSVDTCLAKGLSRADKTTKDSAFGAARDVQLAWEAEHGAWRRRQWDYDAESEPF